MAPGALPGRVSLSLSLSLSLSMAVTGRALRAQADDENRARAERGLALLALPPVPADAKVLRPRSPQKTSQHPRRACRREPIEAQLHPVGHLLPPPLSCPE